MWLSRDLDMERARTADFSMSMNRPPDPYRHRGVSEPHPLSPQLSPTHIYTKYLSHEIISLQKFLLSFRSDNFP